MISLTACLLLACSACSTSPKGQDVNEAYNRSPHTVYIPGNLSPDQIQNAMKVTLIGRRWHVVSANDQEVVGELVHRGIHGRVILRSNGNRIEIYNDSYKLDRNGTKGQPIVPKGWLANLHADLPKNLFLSARQ